MKMRIHSEILKEQIINVLEYLREQNAFFEPFSKQQLLKFEQYFKFVSFKEKSQLTKRGEPVDYLGFIIKGSAQALIDNSRVIYNEGDCIGYMSAMKLQGSEIHQFDIFAKEDGFLAFIQLQDMRLLTKRDPQFMAFLYFQLSCSTLDSVSNQFLGTRYRNIILPTPLETSSKKITLMLDNLGVKEQIEPKKKKVEIIEEVKTFRHFWNELEQKDKRLFVSCSKMVEVQSQESIAKIHQNANCFYIILQGDLVEFSGSKPGKIYSIGETIGIKEFMTGTSYNSNIMGRQKSLLLRVSRSNIQDMIEQQGLSSCAILQMLTRYEAYQIRQQFEIPFQDKKSQLQTKVINLTEDLKVTQKPLSKNEQQTTDQLMNNYFEIDTAKIDKQSTSLEQNVIAPLYLLDDLKVLIAKRGFQPTEIKDRKDPMFETGLSIFLRDKANEQRMEALRAKQQLKQAIKSGKQIDQEKDEPFLPLSDDPYESLNNDYYKVVQEKEKLEEQILQLQLQIKQMQQDHKEGKEELQKMQTQIRKVEVHKELLALDLASILLLPTDQTLKKKHTLFDNYKQQMIENKKFKRTVNAAEKLMTNSFIK